MTAPAGLARHNVTVLLVDDQPIIGEAVRRMLAGESDIAFHYCRDANKAIESAETIEPTVILQDLVMPDIEGLDLVSLFRERDGLRDIPMIVLSTKEEAATKAEAFARGANDYLVKLPDKLELLARIRYHSRGYINKLERDEAYKALLESRELLARDIATARRYVASLLPDPIAAGRVLGKWRFIPSADLGGDAFGYHWLDDEHFAFYLLDVCGHGVGAALLSVSALNALRSQSLPSVDFRSPSQVLAGLNRAFPMEQQNDMYFTIWYGVYHRPSHKIDYSGGGHPPALLRSPESQGKLLALESRGPMVGALPDLEYAQASHQLADQAKLYLFSDGVYEIEKSDGAMWPYHEFVDFLGDESHGPDGGIDRLIQHARAISGKDDFNDDFSMVELDFNRNDA